VNLLKYRPRGCQGSGVRCWGRTEDPSPISASTVFC